MRADPFQQEKDLKENEYAMWGHMFAWMDCLEANKGYEHCIKCSNNIKHAVGYVNASTEFVCQKLE